jgi:predicted Fe-Mo cluster-binding NifX family protein
LRNLRIALPTTGHRGVKDRVSQVFSRASTFTIVEIVDGETRSVEVLENEAAGLSQGAGPLAVRTLKDRGVDLVASGDLGPGASTLLETLGIEFISVEPGSRVSQALETALGLTR